MRTRAGLVLAAALVAASPAPAQAPAEAQLLGRWDLVQAGAARQCTLTFAADAAAHGRTLRFPATCRRALPFLARAAGWSATADGRPQLIDAAGQPLVSFDGREGALSAKGPDGKDYALNRVGAAPARQPAPSAAELAATAARRPTPVDPATAPAPETLPGVYALMRQRGREACRLRLEDGGGARFEGACADTGLTIFDPMGWRYQGGRLSLVARRGHTVELIREGELWRKDPAVGAPLMMRPLP